jgi:hypothetical protein
LTEILASCARQESTRARLERRRARKHAQMTRLLLKGAIRWMTVSAMQVSQAWMVGHAQLAARAHTRQVWDRRRARFVRQTCIKISMVREHARTAPKVRARRREAKT